MTGVLIGLIVAAAGAIWGLIARGRLKESQHDAESLRADRDRLQQELATAEAAAADQAKRLEAVIAAYRREVAALEADLAKCQDPGVIRDRLRKLLGVADGS